MNELYSEVLYNKLKPALNSKIREFNVKKMYFIDELDIWNYLKNKVWIKKEEVFLCDLVSDIIYADNKNIINYLVDKLKQENSFNSELL